MSSEDTQALEIRVGGWVRFKANIETDGKILEILNGGASLLVEHGEEPNIETSVVELADCWQE